MGYSPSKAETQSLPNKLCALCSDCSIFSLSHSSSTKQAHEPMASTVVRAFQLAQNGAESELKAMIDSGEVAPDAVRTDGMYQGFSLLHAAASKGHSALCCYLVEAGASVFARDATNNTALHLAASAGHAETCNLLVRCGAQADAVNSEGCTPLDGAASDACRAILEAGLDEQYEHWSEKSYDSAQDDRPWH